MEREQRQRIIQGIKEEDTFPSRQDMEAQDDELFYRLAELVEHGILSVDEGQECFDEFRRVYGR